MPKRHVFIGVVLTICAGFLFAQTAVAPTVGDGSSDNPYRIATLANLRWLSENSDKWASGKYFIQTTDIDASETQYWNDGEGFSPIGKGNIRFQGNYDGNGHTISGIYINRPSSDYQSFFGRTYDEAEVSNLGLINIDIAGQNYVGGLIGWNYGGTVSNCYASGSVSGSRHIGGLIGLSGSGSVLNCYASGSVSAVSNVGGLIGDNGSSVLNSYASGSVSGENYVGGLIGYYQSGIVSNCYANGVVTGSTNVGGLIGYCTISDIITACFWDTQTSGQDISAGGNGKTTAEMKAQSTYIEAGWKFMADADTYHEGEYWFSSNSGYPVHAWGVIQTVNTLKATDITESTATLNGRLYANGYATTVEFEWGTTDTYGNTVVIGSYGAKDYLDLSTTLSELTKNTLYHYRIKATHTQGSEVKTSYGIDMIIYTGAPATAPDAGNGSSGNPYQIATLANLRWLSENSDKWASGKYFIQTTDIDASETQYWDNGEGFSPIGESSIRFQGNYDGNGHTISGIYINRSSTYFIGLFGFIYTGANIRNLGLIDAEIIGCYFIGSLIGCNREASVSNCYASGTVSGGNSVGGLIGHILGGSVSNCYASGSVSGVSTVDGLLGSSVGGLIGSNDYASVSNCYASGAVSGESSVGGLIGRNYLTTVLNCYASGAVSGEYSVGGLIGSLSGTISACFWDNTVNSGLDGVGYGYSGDQVTGETTTKMQTKSIYTDAGWDFLTVWGINDTINEGYPHLYWQSPLPRIIIGSIEDITIGSVDIYGDLFYAGSSYPLQHGFCWNTEGEPSLEDDFIELGPVPSTGVFRAQITGLTSNTLYYIRAYATNEAETVYSQVISFTTLKTGIVEGIPSNYVLSQNYPNPFNPTTTLQYGLPEASDVDLMIFDITGRKIKSWHISSQQAGWHKVIWNGTNQYDQQISTGVYIYSLRAGDFVDTKKMVFMK